MLLLISISVATMFTVSLSTLTACQRLSGTQGVALRFNQDTFTAHDKKELRQLSMLGQGLLEKDRVHFESIGPTRENVRLGVNLIRVGTAGTA